jgi:hypothetical protein
MNYMPGRLRTIYQSATCCRWTEDLFNP